MITAALKLALDRRYHRRHRLLAGTILRRLEGVLGETDRKSIRCCGEYAEDVLGWRGYAPWLYVYSAMSGGFREGWIPDNYYGKVVKPALKGEYGEVSDLKSVTNMIFRSEAIPDRGYYVNGMFFTERHVALTDSEIAGHVFGENDRIVYKLDHSRQGKGVLFMTRDAFDANRIRALGGNGVFQEYIRQHEFFDRIVPSSTATLRLTTALDDAGDFSVRACYLRVGRMDETHVRSGTHIRIAVDRTSGELSTPGYLPSWLPVECHPDTGFAFSGNVVPEFSACVETALGLHRRMPYARCIGWDLCVADDNRVRVMEWNGNHNDIKFSEATQGPCFADLGWEKLGAGGRRSPGTATFSRTVSQLG